MHRTDVQSAYDSVTPVDPALAVDGVDEVLHLMLAGDWSEDPQPDSVGTIVVATGGRTWRVTLESDHVGVTDEDTAAAARVDGEPSELLLWLWGRRPQSVVRTGGDEGMIRRLRERLALATQ